MATGTGLWLAHYVLGWETFFAPWLPWPVPTSLAATACSLTAGGWVRGVPAGAAGPRSRKGTLN